MKRYVNSRFNDNEYEYVYVPNLDYVGVRDLSKYGQPFVKHLKEGGIYDMLKGNYEARVLLQELKRKSRNIESIKYLVYELNR